MNIKQIIKEELYQFIIEAKYSDADYMFHGTSSKFLRSILKIGLKANPQQLKYDDNTDPLGKRSDTLSLKSYGGVYLAKSMHRAIDHSEVAVDKFGGEKIVIVTKSEKKSAVADEDYIVNNISNWFNLVYRSYEKGSRAEDEFVSMFSKWSKYQFDKIPVPEDKLKLLYNFLYDRRKAIAVKDYELAKDHEINARSIIDFLTQRYRIFINKTRRHKNDITFRGKNRIVAIFAVDSSSLFSFTLKRIYGNLNPAELDLSEYEPENKYIFLDQNDEFLYAHNPKGSEDS